MIGLPVALLGFVASLTGPPSDLAFARFELYQAYGTILSAEQEKASRRVDSHGDPLPPGAAARLGTVRFRSADGFESLAYTPDGRHLVSGGRGGARVWDAATGHLVRRLGNDLPSPSQPAGLSPDGKLVAVGGWQGGGVYELASGKLRYHFGMQSYPMQGKFSPDSRTLAWFPRNDGAIVLLEAATGKEKLVLKGHKVAATFGLLVSNIAFTPDGKTLISAGGDGVIRVWDVKSGKEIRTIDAADVADIALSPDGSLLAAVFWKIVDTGNGSKWGYRAIDIKLWHTQTGKEAGRMSIHPLKKNDKVEYGPRCFAFSPDGRELIAGAYGGGLRVWDVAAGKERRRLVNDIPISGMAFSAKGQLAVIERCSIRLLDYETGRDLVPIAGHRSNIESAVPSADGRIVAVLDDSEKCIVLWDAKTGREKRRLDIANETIRSLILARDGRTLLATTTEKSLWTWDLAGQREPRRLKLPFSGTLRSSPDGKILAVSEGDKIHLLDAADGKELRTLTGGAHGRTHFDFTPDGRAILAWTEDKLHRWDTLTGAHTAKDFYRLENWPFSAVFSPDGRLVTFGVQNSDVLPVVEVATGKEICRFKLVPKEPSQTLAWVAFAPDSRSLAWGGRNEGSAWLGELATGEVRQQFSGHGGRVAALAWSADGRTLVTGSADTTALVWPMTGRLPADGAGSGALSEADLAASWNSLREKDGKGSYAALRLLTSDPARSVAFLTKHLKSIEGADAPRVAALVADLDASNFAKREQATRALEKLGEPALGALTRKLKDKPPLETARRLEGLIAQIRALTPERLQAIRAVEALELIGSAEARQLLARLAAGLPDARLSREAKESLGRLDSMR